MVKVTKVSRPVSSVLNASGQEIPDSVPLEAPVGMARSHSTSEIIRNLVRQELSQLAELQEMETFSEADDFDVDDDPMDPLTPYEAVFDPPPRPDPPVGEPLAAPAEPVGEVSGGGGSAGGEGVSTSKPLAAPAPKG